MKSLFKQLLKKQRPSQDEAFKRTGVERRKFPRVRTRNLAKLFCSEQQELTNLYDVSEGGICMRVTQPLQRGTAIETKVNLKELEAQAAALGEVAWISRGKGANHSIFHAGISFTDLSQENRAKLRDFVNQTRDRRERRTA